MVEVTVTFTRQRRFDVYAVVVGQDKVRNTVIMELPFRKRRPLPPLSILTAAAA